MGLNCVVHQREAMEDTLKLMQPFIGRLRGVFHCFSSDAAISQRILNMNCLVSYTGIVTYKNAPNVRNSLTAVPLGKFMLETDCPYMIPEPHRGKVRRNEPMHVKEISQVAAEVKGMHTGRAKRGNLCHGKGVFQTIALQKLALSLTLFLQGHFLHLLAPSLSLDSSIRRRYIQVVMTTLTANQMLPSTTRDFGVEDEALHGGGGLYVRLRCRLRDDP